jgi:hypothetical protein
MKLLEQYSSHQAIFKAGYRFNPDDETFFTSDTKTFTFPEDEAYKNWKVQPIKRDAYLIERLTELGIKDQDHKLELIDENGQRHETPIFTANQHGDIEILQFSLKRKIHTYDVKTTSAGTVVEWCAQKRINPNITAFTEGKYDFKEAINTPFWAPSLVDAYENETEIETLTITEGQFKAFKAANDGIPTVGLTSISHFRDKKFNTIHPEIIDFIRACKVQNLVILWDGDCRNISQKDVDNKTDLTNRPGQFYNYARTIKKLLQKFFPPKKLTIYFATIATDDIPTAPKGIDDLLTVPKLSKKDVKTDFDNIGQRPGYYISWINITGENGEKEMRKFFNLAYVSDFYAAHQERIKTNNFVFYGTTYRIEKGLPVVEIDRNLKKYMRIGPDYFRLITEGTYNNDGEKVREDETLVPWKAAEITRDFGKEALNNLQKLDGFCNIPNHTNYKQIVDNKYNLYNDVRHEAAQGEWPNIKKFLKHIFGDQLDMGLDYIQLLYSKPYQKLPVLCLVSKEEGTGKSLFLNFLYMIFQNNMAFVTPDDILGQWSSHWISKLVVASEETFFEKKEALEKIKSVSTADKYMRSERFVNASMIDCFVHFVFCSNHEDNFIKLTGEASRFWVRKVHSIPKEQRDTELKSKMQEEMAAFMYFIQNRTLVHEKRDRMWFDTDLTKTDAFYNIVSHSEPGVIKDLRIQLEDYFMKHRVPELRICVKDLRQHFGLTGNDYFLNVALREYMKAEKSKEVGRYFFYIDSNTNPDGRLEIKGKGRYLTFYAKDFIDENFIGAQMFQEAPEMTTEELIEEGSDELPF